MMIINPGSGPVEGATRENALGNLTYFFHDLEEQGKVVGEVTTGLRELDDDGRLRVEAVIDGRMHEIDMPGLPVEQVRYLGHDNQNIWDFPRLYVDGSSWLWMFALGVCGERD